MRVSKLLTYSSDMQLQAFLPCYLQYAEDMRTTRIQG